MTWFLNGILFTLGMLVALVVVATLILVVLEISENIPSYKERKRR